jgi:hypothetical protein
MMQVAKSIIFSVYWYAGNYGYHLSKNPVHASSSWKMMVVGKFDYEDLGAVFQGIEGLPRDIPESVAGPLISGHDAFA